jgi:hypothetical protein
VCVRVWVVGGRGDVERGALRRRDTGGNDVTTGALTGVATRVIVGGVERRRGRVVWALRALGAGVGWAGAATVRGVTRAGAWCRVARWPTARTTAATVTMRKAVRASRRADACLSAAALPPRSVGVRAARIRVGGAAVRSATGAWAA